ncbi:MAG: hypothetical protein E5X49_29390 [Mesorhizobium sp.]|nr:MAG: hypothetical protein E5X49_29390 [Mesorhizobium sp.]
MLSSGQKALRRLGTYLGRTIRGISRQITAEAALEAIFCRPLYESLDHSGAQAAASRDTGHHAPRAPAGEPVIGHIKNEHRMGRNYSHRRRCDQRHPGARRLQFLPPAHLAEAIFVALDRCASHPAETAYGLESGLFTVDSVALRELDERANSSS